MSKTNTTAITSEHARQQVAAAVTLTKADIQKLSVRLRDSDWHAAERLRAWRVFTDTPMPSITDDAWRRTDIRGLRWPELKASRSRSASANGLSAVPARLLRPLVGGEHGGQLVINRGKVVERNLAASLRRKGVIFTDFLTATRQHSALLRKYLGKSVPASQGKFAAMAACLADQGVFVYVPRGVKVELPLHSVIWADAPAQFSRLVVVAEADSALTFVHELASQTQRQHAVHVGTVEVYAGRNANLQFIELQSLGQNVWHFAHERSRVQRDGKLDWIFSAIGSRLTKNFCEIDLVEKGAWGRMSGFYFAEGDQHLDHDTQQNHHAEHTTSDLLFKGALRDRSRSVWQGMIYVAPGAQKTDGYQANRNLVLSKQARADSIPGLEILADDVRCTHGATIGQLEMEHMFYLMSRGMPEAEARRVLVDGFFDPVMERIPFEGVRERLKRVIAQKMG